MVPLAFADEAEGAAASPSVGSEVALPTDKEASLNKALDDVATLEAGTDYDPGTMLALIDGAAVQADGSLTSGLQGGGEGISSLGSVEPVATGSWLGGLALVRVDVPDGMSTEEAAALLAADDNVVDFSLGYVCEPEYLSENAEAEVSTNDDINDALDKQWHLGFAEVPGAWSYMQNPDGTRVRGNVTVAVVDSGCDLDHPDLVANLDLENAYDVVTGGPLQGEVFTERGTAEEEFAGDNSPFSHGTHVCGIIGAETNNGIGTAGVSYDAKVLPINVFDPGTKKTPTGAIEAAFDYLFGLIDKDINNDINIKVVNLSVGSDQAMPLVAEKLKSALEHYNLTVVASAGNGGTSGEHYPSDYEQCISVINATPDRVREKNSNYGSGTDISAPGFHVWSTVDGGSYGYKCGTSMAAAIVSGVAALLYTMDPDATAQQVRDAIIKGADSLSDPTTAAGMVSATNAMELLLFGVDYTDVETEEWYVVGGYFTYVGRAGLMKGYSGTSLFGPELDMTRAEFATVLYRMANPDSGATTDPSLYENDRTGFADAVSGEYYTAALNWAKDAGIMTGDSSTNYTTVRPNDSLSRQEAAVMSQRFAGALGADTSVANMSTPDLLDWDDVASWARDAMTWCYHNAVISGWDNRNGTHSALPLKMVDRAQMTKIATVLDLDFAKKTSGPTV